jgi:hypothetical protein
MAQVQKEPDVLKGWQKISDFLGQPLSVVERWAKTGLPVERKGRSVVASAAELRRWLQRETGEPVHLATEDANLTADLKRSVAQVLH